MLIEILLACVGLVLVPLLIGLAIWSYEDKPSWRQDRPGWRLGANDRDNG